MHTTAKHTIVRVGYALALQLHDDPGSTRPLHERARHQYLVAGGVLWSRRLPPAEIGDAWADVGVPVWEARSRQETPRVGPVAEWMRRAQQVPIAILRRLRHSDDRQAERAEVYCSGGAYIRCDAIGDVAIALGPVTDSWWDLPPPPCPDCGAELVWGEAGRVPGARACTGCGSVFTVETETDRRS